MNAIAQSWLHYISAMLWQSSIVMLAVWAIYLALRRSSAALRYALLCLVLIKLLLPVGFHAVTGLGHWTPQLAEPAMRWEIISAQPDQSSR